jgi:DUF1009 family protein
MRAGSAASGAGEPLTQHGPEAGQGAADQGGAVGLLCGAGLLPVRVAQSLARRGRRVVAVCIEGEADQAIASVCAEVHWTGLAKLGRWIRLFREARVEAVLMCGGIRKRCMFASRSAMMPDWRTLKLWYERLKSREDHAILGAVVEEFEKEGIRVGSVPQHCPELMAPPGCLTRKQPTARQWRDIRFAWPIAKQVAALQIGQCVVVKDLAVVAVEGIDGTDAALERGGSLAGSGAVAVKVSKEGHDERFDIPCVGPDTADVLRRSGVSALALEAGRTVLLDREEVKRKADAARVCIIAVTAEGVREADP